MSDFNSPFPFGGMPFDPNSFDPKQLAQFLREMGIDPNTVVPGGVENLSPQAFQQMMQQASFIMNASDQSINWQLVQQLVRQKAWGDGDPQLSAAQAAQARQNLQIADLWLDAVTEIAPVASERKVWRRSDWADETLEIWKIIIEPIAENVQRAFKETMAQQAKHFESLDEVDLEHLTSQPQFEMLKQLPGMQGVDGLKSLLSQSESLMAQLSSAIFSMHIGRALGELSTASLGSTDVGIPSGKDPVTALVLPNVDAFAAGFEIPVDEVRQFLALRECAHARLFASVPWLKAEFLAAIRAYAAAISIDTDAIREAMSEVNAMDEEALQVALTGRLFKPEPSEAQLKQLAKLEWLLALIEGWVETVTFEAARTYLPNASQLHEIMRRRRIDGSPAEQVLAQLIGLRMRPVKARNAAELWELLGAGGKAERDAYWRHPDVAPTAAELDKPLEFLENRQLQAAVETSIDDELSSLLDGTLGWAEGLSPEDDSEGDRQI
ncbi:zinc-dependent metalloprotease [Gleimia sp. 6138-11-ORH1]|uniref:zinc-dependent metalloprotease n=1 Tax=Gleimia sp. 6138-11-ORH1 TaxID=2973937 RepID=UPI0021685F53|nr:zinc-dependent metalloprotease [Gleimia sp. 6138-11-ORH1]MCS4483903.1 zinc-dependent metalloprotease [Gleimia sp. 6138-11-ORH1]